MGTVVVTIMIVQFFKEFPYVKNIPTKYFTFLVALVNILVCTFALGKFTVANIYLIFINAILVTFSATGTYDFHVGKIGTVVDEAKEEVKSK